MALRRLILILSVLSFSLVADAQFYLGHQMTFGKNRVQYRNFVWRYMRFPRYDVYFYEGGKPIAHFVAKYAASSIRDMESFFDYDLTERLVFITYNNLREFKQTNLGLHTGNVNMELSATTQLLNNKIIVFYKSDHEQLRYEIRRAVAEYTLKQMLFGRGFTKKFYTSTVSNLPDWYLKGLSAYAADPYNTEADNYMRDLILHSKYIKLNHLKPEQAEYVGYSFWSFISDQYGKDVIPNLVYFTRLSKNLSNAFYYVLGQKLKQLNKQWFDYCKQKYTGQIKARQPIDSSLVLKKYKKRPKYQQIRYSPKNGLFAYVMNDLGRYKVIIYDPQKHKKKVIYRQGQRLPQITDFSYPLLAWKPDGSGLTFITEEKGIAFINQYDIQTHKHTKAQMGEITKIYSIAYSPNGRYLVLSGQKDGYIDLFLYNVQTGILQRITYDPYDDLNPRFIDRSRRIIFASNRGPYTYLRRVFRVEDADSISRTFDLYIYDLRHRSKKLLRLTNTPYSNETEPYGLKHDYYMFLSDTIGITNRLTINYDSTVSSVDTAVHYKYFTTVYPVTNYPTSILQQDFTGRNKISEDKYWYKRYLLSSYEQNFRKNKSIISGFKPTDTRLRQISLWQQQDQQIRKQYKQKIREQHVADSIAEAMQKYKPKIRDTAVDINHYTFEIERDSMLRIYYYYQLKQKHLQQEKSKWGKVRVYMPTFYLNSVSTSLDYGQLVQSYQPFTGSTFIFSPGMNIFTVTELNELFEDYRIIGGFRLNNDLRSAEYLASFEELSKRLDKQILFHRNAIYQNLGFVGYNYTMTKTVTTELLGALRWPFNQVSSVRFTLLGRYDRKIYLATDQQVFKQAPENFYYVSGKLEYIYDNSRELGPNLRDGIRAKAFLEGFQQIKGNQYWTAITGFDFRFYKEIWRNMIFAWRLSGSTNTGSGKLIYYLGGVDYWYVLNLNPLSTENKQFYTDVNINYNNNYIFQAVATPMRGYKQNIRNGTTFLLMNTEVRMPVVKMFFNVPTTSEFWANFQLVGFFDLGSAWCGWSPYDPCNAYNTYNIHNPPITVIVDMERPPYVAGYGFGIRTKLLGYFTRFDFAWGLEGGHIHPMQFYLSLAYDF